VPFILRRAIIRPTADVRPRVRGGAFLMAPVSVPTPVGITLVPSNMPALSETALAGTVVGVASVATSDGSQFAGSVGFGAPFQNASGLLTVTGATLSLTRTLSAADMGTYNFTVSATQNSVTTTTSFALTVSGVTMQVDPAGDVQAVDAAGDVLIVQ
jgi:hypothetical protein